MTSYLSQTGLRWAQEKNSIIKGERVAQFVKNLFGQSPEKGSPKTNFKIQHTLKEET